MRTLFFGFLILAAVGLLVATLVGVAIKIVFFIAMVVIAIAALGWVMSKFKGPKNTQI